MSKLAICLDHLGWWKRFEEFAIAAKLDYVCVEIERSDWLERLDHCSHILWRPNLDCPYCEEAKEKLKVMVKATQEIREELGSITNA